MRRIFCTAFLTALACAGAACSDDAEMSGVAVASRATDTTREVSGRVVIAPKLADDAPIKAQLSIDAGAGVPAAPQPNAEPRSWRDVKLAARAVWSAPEAKVSLEALGEMRFPPDGGLREDRTARAGVQLRPRLPVTLDLGGEVSEAQSVQPQPGSGGGPVSVHKAANAVSAGLSWTVFPQLVLKGSERVEAASLAWKGQGLYLGDGAVTQPRLEGQMRPWGGAQMNIAFERVSGPFDADKFAALASAMFRVEPDGAVRAFHPDQEWRVSASGAQQLGKAKLSIAMTDASLINSTELGLSSIGTAAPVSVTGGWRSDVQLGLDLPITAPGAPAASLHTALTMRASALRDPVTGEARPISGEAAYEGRISLELASAVHGLSFGLDTRLTGPRTYYEPDRLREIAAAGILGSFVEYRADEVAVRLQIDNLLSDASRSTETLYQHDRSSGQILQVDRKDGGGAGFTLTLRRKV